ncbi:MAG: PAS domain-containing protein [Halococcoides sp.]
MADGTDRAAVIVLGSFGDPRTPPGRVVETMTDLAVRSVPDAAAVTEAATDGAGVTAGETDPAVAPAAIVLADPPVTEDRLADCRDRAPELPIVLVGQSSSITADALDDAMVRAVRDDGTDRTARVVGHQILDLLESNREPGIDRRQPGETAIDLATVPLPAFAYDGGFRAANRAFLDSVDRASGDLRGEPISSVFDCDEGDLASAATDGRPLTVTTSGAARRPLWVGRDGDRSVGILGPGAGSDGGALPAASILESLLEAMPLSIYVKDRQGRHVAVSRHQVGGMAADRSTIDAPDGTIHHVPADVVGKTDFDLYPDANAEQFSATDERVVEDGETVVERETVRLTGDERRFAVTDLKVPWYRDGEIAGVIGIAIDDTDSWRAKRRAAIQADVLETVETVLRTELGPRLAGETSDDAIATAIDDLQTLLSTRQLPHAAEATDLGDRSRSVWADLDAAGTLSIRDSAVIDAHPTLLETLLREVFENAITFAGPDPTVRIGMLDQGFVVEDDGPGIPPGRRSDVLRYGTSERDDRLGSGLAICAAIARAHGWELTITDGSAGGVRLAITDVRIY